MEISNSEGVRDEKGKVSREHSGVRVPGVILLIHRDKLESPSTFDFLKENVEHVAALTVKKGKKHLIALTISGYDTDPRELFEIPEVCNWARSVFELVPSLYYFLTVDAQWRFVGWLCGPITKREIDSAAFKNRFDEQHMSCTVKSIFYGEEMLIKHGASEFFIEEVRKYDIKRAKLSIEIPEVIE